MTEITTTDGTEMFKVSDIFGSTIASPYDQHVICAIIGKTGEGKSNAALDIAYKTSIYMANKLGGVPEDYFTMKNVAIISMDSIIDVMKNMKKQNIYIFDDIGTGWNARDFAKNSNKIMNNIIQTFRKWQTLLIMTMPDTMLIDTVPRNLLHYQIEMSSSDFKHGITIGKLSHVKKMYRSGKTIYPYPVRGVKASDRPSKVKYVRTVFERAAPHIVDDYETKRTAIQEAEQKKYTQQLEELHKVIDSPEMPPKVTTKERILELRRDVAAGIYETLKAACKANEISYDYAKRVKETGY